jgi:hypothetical protein
VNGYAVVPARLCAAGEDLRKRRARGTSSHSSAAWLMALCFGP